MAKNRRSQSAAIRFGPALKAVALCLVIGGSAVGYVWQKDQIRQLELRLTEGEQTLETLRRQNEKLQWELDAHRSPANLEQLVERYQMGLVQPSPDQVIRLPEPDVYDAPSFNGEDPLRYAAVARRLPGRSY